MATLGVFAVAALAFAAWTVRAGKLTLTGAAAAVVLAATVTFSAGPEWLLPLFVFFLSSVAIGRLLPVRFDAGDEKDLRPRDAVQVLCNGGIYGVLSFLDVSPTLLLVPLAVATADTWASEVGKYFRRPTYDILRLGRVPPGLSGGVSGAGTLAGAVGATLLAGCGIWLAPVFSVTDWLTASGWGFAGMVVDSVLGSALQARYRTPRGTLGDRGGAGHHRVSGLAWMSNDLVNFFSILLTVVLAYWVMVRA